MKTAYLPPLLSLLTLLCGCATMFSDSVDSVTIDTEPQGAEITFNGDVLGRTPLKISMRRQMEAPYITIRKEGYVTRTGLLDRNIAPAAFANFLFFPTSGATSWGIDALTGNMFKFADDAYVYVLEKKGTALRTPHPLGYFVTNFRGIQREIAQGQRGEYFAGLCGAGLSYELSESHHCAQLWINWQARPNVALMASNGLDLYRVFEKDLELGERSFAPF